MFNGNNKDLKIWQQLNLHDSTTMPKNPIRKKKSSSFERAPRATLETQYLQTSVNKKQRLRASRRTTTLKTAPTKSELLQTQRIKKAQLEPLLSTFCLSKPVWNANFYSSKEVLCAKRHVCCVCVCGRGEPTITQNSSTSTETTVSDLTYEASTCWWMWQRTGEADKLLKTKKTNKEIKR